MYDDSLTSYILYFLSNPAHPDSKKIVVRTANPKHITTPKNITIYILKNETLGACEYPN
jgi:hypothetical protein